MRSSLIVAALIGGVLAVAGAAYLQGLGGSFLVDDYPNLASLAVIGTGDVYRDMVRFSLDGFSSPLGRPLALLTFALQYRSWPASPADFIYVNILLHLLNGCLLAGACLRLLTLVPRSGGSPPPAIAAAALFLWLLAAPQTGAVLYVIQRMALLSGTFVLLGLWLYLAGRAREAEGRWRSGFLLMLAGLGCAVPLGYLAKETSALFPLLLLALEATVLRELPRSRAFRLFTLPCLWLPAVVILGYLAWVGFTANPVANMKSFTTAERLLTEGRVLFLYLHKALLPPLYSARIYYDDLPVSHSLLDPWTTLASLLGWAALVAAAVALRRREPMFAFAVSWFLGAHLLESTVIPLELAFDHRNYIALAGVALAVPWYGWRALRAERLRRLRPLLAIAMAAYAAFLLVACWQTSALWGRPWEMAHYWSQQQPDSKRAQTVAGKVYWHYGHPEEAMASQERALQRWPGDVGFFLNMLEIGCAFPQIPTPDLSRLPAIVARYDTTIPAAVGTLDTLVSSTEEGGCTRYSPTQLWAVTAMIFETPSLAPQAQNRLLLQARIAELAHDRALARTLLDEAIRTPPAATPFMLLRAAQWSMLASDLACADHYSALYAARGAQSLKGLAYQEQFAELSPWRAKIAADPAYVPRRGDLPACQNAAMGNPT